MDFFGQQDLARRKTTWLMVYFAIATILVVLAVHVAAAAIGAMVYRYAEKKSHDGFSYSSTSFVENDDSLDVRDWETTFQKLLFDPMLFFATTGLTLVVILGGSAYKTMELSGGGEGIASLVGGRRVQSNTSDPGERQLLNIVEEMSLASGVPVPPVYVLDEETSINAFAAGYTIHDAVIAVTSGTLECLTRDELQGVIAHEFSHVLNGDMKLSLRLIGVIYGLLVIAIIGYYILRTAFYSSGSGGRRDGRGVTVIAAAGAALCAIGGIGYATGTLIKWAISRQREYLADAAAVQFTRNPGGIAGALKKIGGRRNTSKIISKHAPELSHIFFGNAFGYTSGWLLSTHPPLADRIRRIDPSFDGTYPEVQPVKHHWEEEVRREAKKPTAGFGDAFAPIMATLPIDAAATGAAGALGGMTGMSGGLRLAYIAALLENLPPQLRKASRETFGARAVVLATLIDRDPEVRARQMQTLREMGDLACTQEVEFLLHSADVMDENARLPLVETTLPNLKSLSPEQYEKFRSVLTELVKADGRVDLFEYTVQTLVVRHLDIHFGKKAPTMIRHRHGTVQAILPEVVRLFSTLAYVGSKKPEDAALAFDKGTTVLGLSASILPKDVCSLRKLGETLEALNDSTPLLKHQVVDACVAVVQSDGQVTPKEYELTQVIGAILEVPIPPLQKG